jgi:acyl-coenzyme A thioesterase PaaI-like protein
MTKGTDRIDLPRLEGFRCFACGSANPIGLHMSFYVEKGSVCSDIVLDENHAGWDTVAHGGILATILDEVMAWTVLVFRRTFSVTRTIEVKFLRPVRLNVPLSVKGEVESVSEKSRCVVTGTIFDPHGIPLVRARGDVAFLPEKRLSLIPAPLRQEMCSLFRKIEKMMDPSLVQSDKPGGYGDGGEDCSPS